MSASVQHPRHSAPLPPWDAIDTVLVDMDGTLLDLAFDNFFWLELVPLRYAEAHGLAEEDARRHVASCSARTAGSLAWYCVDHWSRELGLDVAELKRRHRHLVRFLPGAREFLAAVRSRGKQLLLVTNAHRRAVEVKVEQTGLDVLVDEVICSHDFVAPKETGTFWARFREARPYEPGRALLIEDSVPVLDAARAHGVGHMIAVRRPDSRLPARAVDGFPAIDGVADLL